MQSVPPDIAEDFLLSQQNYFEKNLQKMTSTTKRKFSSSLSTANSAHYVTATTSASSASASNSSTNHGSTISCLNSTDYISSNTKAIHNATQIHLPPETETLLSLGPKFGLPFSSVNQVPVYHIIADLESILCTSSDKAVRDRNRCALANIMQNYLHGFPTRARSPLDIFVAHACRVTKKFISDNPDVIIVQSDKGKQTVIMYATEYEEKMKQLLSDKHTYKSIGTNPTTKFLEQNNNIVDRLRNLNLIDQQTANRLRVKTAFCPRIYALPKSHKPNLPLRPVAPNIGAPSYMMSKYIAGILQQSLTSQYNIRDTFSFCRLINDMQLPEGYVLVSFDVVSLFTCIPRDLVINTIINSWSDIQKNTAINLDFFLEIIDFCLECSYFSFRGKIYKQIDGTSMGNCASPIICDWVMERLLDTVYRQIDFPLPLLKKYVDDLVLALPENKITQVLAIFNSFHPNIQFTCEVESNQRLPFLDLVMVRQADQTVKTEWYSKPMSSGRFLDYHSNHPLHMKMNVAMNFIHRVRLFSTNLTEKEKNNIIKRHLQINHYPTSLVHRLINTKLAVQTSTAEPEPIQHTYRSLPFVDNLSARIKKAMKAEYSNVVLADKNVRTVGGFFTKTKDKIPFENKHNVIYCIPCAENGCDANYVGLTSRHLKKRMSDHKTNMNQLDQLLKSTSDPDETEKKLKKMKENSTALIQHCIDEKHRFDLQKTTILDQHYRKSALPVLKVCHIVNTDSTINIRTDVDYLSSTYAGLLHTVKKNKLNINVNTLTHQNTTQNNITNREAD